jgi:Beta-lactamase enzyme family
MSRISRGPVIVLVATAAMAGFAVATIAPAVANVSLAAARSAAARAARAAGVCSSAKNPELAAQISAGVTAALASRVDSTVGLTVSDPGEDLTCALHSGWHFDAASVIKVTTISALLLKEGGPSGLSTKQRDLAWQMITQSNDDAATKLWNDVGMTDMQVFLDQADMRHAELSYAWGLTQLTAQDEMTLLHLLTNKNNVLSNASRGYVLWLMAHVTASQRWGVPAGAPSDVTVHVKDGWLPYPDTHLKGSDWRINSIGAFTGKGIGYQIVILTEPRSAAHPDQTEGYGIATVQSAAEVINKDLAKA